MATRMGIEELKSQIAVKRGELAGFNKLIEVNKKSKEDLLKTIDDKISTASITEDELTDLNKQVNDIISETEGLEPKIEVAKSELETLEAQLSEIEAAVIKDNEDGAVKGNGNKNNKKEGSDSDMENVIKRQAKVLKDFIKGQSTKFTGVLSDEVRKEFITTEDNRIVIPEDTKYVQEHEDVVDFRDFINVVKVSAPSGKTITSSRTRQGLQDKTETGDFPLLQGLLNEEKSYDTKAKGGRFIISHELVKDAAFDVEKFFNIELQAEKLITYNKDILAEFNKLDTLEVTNNDEVKLALEGAIPLKYGKKVLVITKSGYEQLSIAKYGDGRYVYQPDVNSDKKFLLHGVTVVKVDDEDLGETGDAIGFLLTKSAVDFFDYEAFNVTFVDNDNLGLKAALYARYGVKLNKKDAGLKIEFNLDLTSETPVDPEP